MSRWSKDRAPPFPTRLKPDAEWRAEGFTVETFNEAYVKLTDEEKRSIARQERDYAETGNLRQEPIASAEGREMSVLNEPWFKAFKLASARGDFLRNSSNDHVERAFKSGFEFDRTTSSADRQPPVCARCCSTDVTMEPVCPKCDVSPTARPVVEMTAEQTIALGEAVIELEKERDAYREALVWALGRLKNCITGGHDYKDIEARLAQYAKPHVNESEKS